MSNISISQEILELESLCQQLYNANSAQQIQEANKLLENFSNSTDCLSKCQMLLDRGASPYSQYISSVVLIKAITRNSVVLTLRNKYELRKEINKMKLFKIYKYLIYILKDAIFSIIYIQDQTWLVL